MADALITDPYREITRERECHRLTLKKMKALMDRLLVNDAKGSPTTKFCRLCMQAPVGQRTGAFRDTCPHHGFAEYYKAEQKRMMAPVRKNKAQGTLDDGDAAPL